MAENVAAVGAGAVFRRIPLVGPIVAPIAAQVKEKCPAPYLNRMKLLTNSYFIILRKSVVRNEEHLCFARLHGRSTRQEPEELPSPM